MKKKKQSKYLNHLMREVWKSKRVIFLKSKIKTTKERKQRLWDYLRKGEEAPKEPNNKKLHSHFFFILPTLT